MHTRLLTVCLTSVLSLAALAAEDRLNLTGTVRYEDGPPVPKATVFIYTAGPKTGTSSLCPSCYADCAKKSQTDTAGAFTLPSLDPTLVFKVLVVASGCESTFVSKVDPAAGPLAVTLKRLDPATLTSKTRIAGMVINEDGDPVAGAVISPEGVRRGESTQWGGIDKFVDPVTCSDDQGFFLLRCQAGVDEVHALVEARNAAKRWATFTPGKDHFVRLEDGVAVTGKVVHNGRGVKDVVLGLATKDRACGNSLHGFEAISDEEGRFLIANVTPKNEYYLFAKMESLGTRGALGVRTFSTGISGTTVDVGELKVLPGRRVAGRVMLSDGKPVPAGTRMFFGRENAWDHTELALDEQGTFELTGVPEESVSLSVRIKGYKFSKRNPSLDWLNGGIVGRIDGDITGLTLLMEPGEWRYNGVEEEDLPAGADSQPREKPLRGVPL